MAYNANDIAKLGHLASLASKVKSELTDLDSKFAGSFRSISVSGNTVSFFTTTDASGTAAASFDFPEELFLSQTGTGIVENFAWSNTTYPGSTNPNLNGKTVLVLAVRGNAATPTVNYSFVDMAKVLQAITAGDNSINANGTTISVKISASSGNLLSLNNDGLFVASDSNKVDKVSGKQLSTNDYTTAEKNKLSGIAASAQVNVIESVKVDGTALTITNKAVNIDLSGKVDKVNGKGLSTNDYTTAEKEKLASIAGGAQANVIESVKVNGTALAVSNKSVNIDLSGKVDKVKTAVSGNIVIFGSNGTVVDSGVKFATDADVKAMLEEYFPAGE